MPFCNDDTEFGMLTDALDAARIPYKTHEITPQVHTVSIHPERDYALVIDPDTDETGPNWLGVYWLPDLSASDDQGADDRALWTHDLQEMVAWIGHAIGR